MKFAKLITILIFGIGLYQPLIAQSFEEANALYEEELYDSSLALYEEILESGQSFELYFNAGNAAYKAGQIGKSILYLEKSLKLSPGNEDATHNLVLANALKIDKESNSKESSAGARIVQLIGKEPNYWANASIYLAIIASLSLSVRLFMTEKRVRNLGLALGLIATLLCVISYGFAYVQKSVSETINSAVVLAPSAKFKISPNETSDNAFILHEGTKVEIKSEKDNWIEAVYKDGKIGWVKIDDVGKI